MPSNLVVQIETGHRWHPRFPKLLFDVADDDIAGNLRDLANARLGNRQISTEFDFESAGGEGQREVPVTLKADQPTHVDNGAPVKVDVEIGGRGHWRWGW